MKDEGIVVVTNAVRTNFGYANVWMVSVNDKGEISPIQHMLDESARER